MPTLPALFAAFLPVLTDSLPDVSGFSLSDTAVGQILNAPQAYIETASDLIAAYGVDGAITAEQVDTSIAFAQAKARSAALIVVMSADLNLDGTLTAQEMGRTKAAVSATARVKLERAFAKADGDGDERVSAPELTAFGLAAAEKALSATDITMTKLIMAFDDNHDENVTVAEVKAGLGF